MRSALGFGMLLVLGCSDEGNPITRLRVSGAFEPPIAEFGDVPIGLSRTVMVELVNTSEAPFTIEKVEGGGAVSIRAVEGLLEGKIVSGGQRVPIEVSFLAIAERTF